MNIDPAIRYLSEVFANPVFVFAICGSLVFGAIIVAVRSTRLAYRIQSDTKAAILAFPETAADSDKAFSALKPSPIVDYLKTETGTLNNIGGNVFRISPANRFFSGHAILDEYGDIRLLDSWPNIFVGIGLFLTFLGLALALWNASRGAASGDISVVKQSVTTLLEFSAVKFTTSLVALLCSIVLTITLRVQRHKSLANIERVLRQLERSYPTITLERISLYKLTEDYKERDRTANSNHLLEAVATSTMAQLLAQNLEELLEQAREQSAHLQSFNSNLAIQLGEALDVKLQPMLQHLTDRVETALRDMGGSIGNTNQTALKTLLDSFVDELRGATKNDSAELQRNLADLATNLGQTSRDLSERMNSVFSGVEATGERFAMMLNEASASFRSEMDQVQGGVGAGLSDALAAIQAAAENSSRQSEQLLTQLSAGATDFRSSMGTGASHFAEEIGRGSRSIEQVVGHLSASVSQFGLIVDKATADNAKSAQISGQRIEELQRTLMSLDTSFQRVNEAAAPFSKAAEHVRGAIDLLRSTETSVQARLSELANAAVTVSSASESLSKRVSENIERLSEGLGNSTERLTNSIEIIAEHSERAGSGLSDAIKATLGEYQARFEAIDRDLQRGLETVLETFATTYEEIRQRVSEVDQQMAESVSKLASFNESLGDKTEDLVEAVDKFASAVPVSR